MSLRCRPVRRRRAGDAAPARRARRRARVARWLGADRDRLRLSRLVREEALGEAIEGEWLEPGEGDVLDEARAYLGAVRVGRDDDGRHRLFRAYPHGFP